jgi:hypothetical protein
MLELFDYPSIEVNKQGQKSEKQIKLIREAVNPGIWLVGGLGLLLLGVCSFFGLSELNGGGSSALNFLGILLAAVGLFAALRGFTTWNLRRKLLKEPVQSAEGGITYTYKNLLAKLVEADHYTAQTEEGKTLHPVGLAGANPKLPPGAYRFYYLNTRHWLLESEPLFSEAEMKENLNTMLARALGYDQAHLDKCRLEANTGLLKTVEGLPKLDVKESNVVIDNTTVESQEFFCTLGDITFQVSAQAHDAIFEALPHRLYYHADEKGSRMAALEVI